MRLAPRGWILYGPLALVCAGGAMALVLTSGHEQRPFQTLVLGELVGLSFVTAGLVGRAHRPANGTGRILTIVGFAFFAGALGEANGRIPFTIGAVVQVLFLAAFVHLLVAYPTGTLATRFERRLVVAAYVLSVACPVIVLLVTPQADPSCGDCPRNLLLVSDSPALSRAAQLVAAFAAAAVMLATIALLVRRWRAASAAYRRSLRLVLLTGGAAAAIFVLELPLAPLLPHTGDVVVQSAAGIAFLAVPFAFLAGLLRGRFARGAVARLIAGLGPAPAPGQLRDALRDVLADPTLELGYWLPDLPGFVDIDGRPFDPDEHGAATFVDGERGRIGVLVHDPALLEERELMEGVVAAARLALENERLHAELRAQLAERERERDFTRLVVDTAPAYFCVVDDDGCIVRFNRTLAHVKGVADRASVAGRPFWEVFADPAGEAEVRAALALAAAAGRSEPHEQTLRAADGTERIVSWSEVMIPDEHGQLRWVLASGLDVTDRTRHEEEQAALRRVATLVATEPGWEELLAAVTREVGLLFRADASSIVRGEGDAFRVVAGWSVPGGRAVTVGRTLASDAGRELWEELGIRGAIAAPIVVNGGVWGAISAWTTDEARAFPPHAEDGLGDFAALVAQAIGNAAARAEVAVLAEEQAALRRVATLVAAARPQREVLEAVTREAGTLFGAEAVNLMRWEGMTDVVTVVGGWHAPGASAIAPQSLYRATGRNATIRMLETGAPVAGVESPEVAAGEGADWEPLAPRCAISAPVIVGGVLWGAVTATRPESDPFPPEAEVRLKNFASLMAQAIGNAEARAELRLLLDEQAALRRVATLVAGEPREAELMAVVTEEAGRLLGADTSNMVRYEDGGAVLVMGEWSLPWARSLGPGTALPVDGHTTTSIVRETGRPARVETYEGVAGELAERLRSLGIRSAIAAPITVDGRLWGAVTASKTTDDPFPPNAEERLARFADLAAQAIANAQARHELAASRARIVEAADDARRKLERNLHDGAQQRLVAISISLRLALAKLAAAPDDARTLLTAASDELTNALNELRELARGIHPAILTDRGLGPALEALAGRAPLPVNVDHALAERLPPPVEAAAYYVVSESLANVAKYARATSVEVRVARRNGVARVEVVDDGVGGADPARGSGLRGLADRVEALEGRLGIESEPAAGTRVWAEIPLV